MTPELIAALNNSPEWQALAAAGWKDISNESYREYIYPSGKTLRINEPCRVLITPSSDGPGLAHRVATADEEAYYVKPGWIAIKWEVARGELVSF